MSDELEARLRRALSEQAGSVEPAGDGLSRIRARTSGRRPWRERWGVPALALGAVAAVLAAVVVLPRVLPASPEPGRTLPPAAPSVAAPAPGASGLPDRAAVWPYASRAEGARRADADVASGRYPDLADPEATAVDFVGSFVGPAGLAARSLGAYREGLRMLVSRDGVPVSTVFLVRVRMGDDAPYVVVAAERTDTTLTLDRPPAVRSTDPVTVGGTVRPGDAEPTVVVELREPGQDDPLAQTTVPVSGPTWSGGLTPLRVPAPRGVVAAWTADADGRVLRFVASATA